MFGVLPGYPKGFCGARGEPPGRQAARCAGVQRHASAAVDAPRPGGGLWGSPTAGARPFLAPRGAIRGWSSTFRFFLSYKQLIFVYINFYVVFGAGLYNSFF